MPRGGLLRSSGFRRLFGAQTVSRWGDTFNQVALVILVYELTRSGLHVAGTVAFEIVPVLLLAPLAGAVADRLPKRRVMIGADLARAALLIALVFGPHRLAVIYAVAFGLAAGSVFFNPASSALVPTLVNEDQLVSANSALWSAAVISQIVLAPVAGLMIVAVGPRPAFAINAGSFVVSALLLRALPADASVERRGRWRRDVVEGFALLRTEPLVRLLGIVQCLAALSAGATSALLVVLAQRRLGLSASGFGLLLSAIGIGAAIGPVFLRVLRVREPSLRWLFGPYALRGGVDIVLSATRTPVIAAPMLGVYGVGTSSGMVMCQTVLQSRLSPALRGRAFALLDVIWQASRLMSLTAGGMLADVVGIQAVYLAGGLLLLAAAAAGVLGARAARLR